MNVESREAGSSLLNSTDMGKADEKGPLQYDLDAPAHTLPFEDVLQKLSVNQESGLSEAEVKNRRALYGQNQLDEGPGVQPFRILVHQVANALTLVSRAFPIIREPQLTLEGLDHGHGCFFRYPFMD